MSNSVVTAEGHRSCWLSTDISRTALKKAKSKDDFANPKFHIFFALVHSFNSLQFTCCLVYLPYCVFTESCK